MTYKVPSMKMMLSETLRLREACNDQMTGSGNKRTATSPKTFRTPEASKKSWISKQWPGRVWSQKLDTGMHWKKKENMLARNMQAKSVPRPTTAMRNGRGCWKTLQ